MTSAAAKETVVDGGPSLKVHLQLEGSPSKVPSHARELAAVGADGVFTFEGQHDVFFPLLIAADSTDLELMTNVAIAGPRSPLHLAHAAWDLQAYSRGRFRLGLGSQIRAHIEKRYSSQWGRPTYLTFWSSRFRGRLLVMRAPFGDAALVVLPVLAARPL